MSPRWSSAAVLAATVAISLSGPTAVHADESEHVVLNEVNCEGTDWIEVLNPTSEAVDLAGWSVTDDSDPIDDDHLYTYPAGSTVPPGGHLVVEQGAAGLPFGVSCGKDTIRLLDPSQVTVDQQALPVTGATAGTWGRLPDGGSTWTWTTPTRQEPNAPVDPPATVDDAWLFDPGNVVEIDFTIDPAELDALDAEPREYVDATMTISDTAHGPTAVPVGLRLKGSTSFRTLAGKAAFRVSLSHQVSSQRLEGLRSLTLNNMVQDPSMVAEALTSATMRAAGVAAPRVGYAFVRLNGAAYGVYANVETIDATFASRWFPSTRHVYENPAPWYDVVPGSAAGFDVDEGSESDRSDLQALVDAANSGPSTWWSRMSDVADMDAVLRMLAAEHAVGHWDGYALAANNYYLHSDADGRFTLVPSGTDQTWRSQVGMGAFGRPILFRACAAVADCRVAYASQVAVLLQTWDGDTTSSLAQSIADTLRPWQALDPRREHTQAAADAAVAAIRAMASARGQQLQQWLSNPAFINLAPIPGGGGGGGGGGDSGGSGGGTDASGGPSTVAVEQAVEGEPLGQGPPQAAPAAAAPAVSLVRGPSAVVTLRPVTASARSALRSTVAVNRPVRLAVTGLRAGARHRLAIRVDGRWLPIGSGGATTSGVLRSASLTFSTPGRFLLRASTSTTTGYVWLQVRGLTTPDAG